MFAWRGAFILVKTEMNTEMNSIEQLMSLPVAAKRLDISLRALYRLMASGQISRPVKVGRSSKLCESDLVQYLAKLKSERL